MIRPTPQRPLRIGIIGAGAVSDYHHVPAIRLDSRCSLGGVCDADPNLVDRRPIEGWLINQSEAILRLDLPLVHPDTEGFLLELHPSYHDAQKACKHKGWFLPSVNMLDGKAKQFDDGLYAAIELLHFQGLGDKFAGNQKLVQQILAKVGPASSAAPYLAAGLTLFALGLFKKTVLADGIAFAKQQGATTIIDVATLTGAMGVALGGVRTGVFCNHDRTMAELERAAGLAGEKIWRLPLDAEYDDQIKSDVADIKNTGGRPAGSITEIGRASCRERV